MGEEGGVGGHPEAVLLGCLDGLDGLLEDALPAHRLVVALLQPVDVHRPGEVGRGLEQVELALHQDRVRAQEDELLSLHQLLGDDVDLGVDQRLAPGDGDHGGAGLLDRPHRLLHRHPAPQDVVGVLDLPAARAGQVALVERLQLHQERELLAPGQALAGEVAGDA